MNKLLTNLKSELLINLKPELLMKFNTGFMEEFVHVISFRDFNKTI